MGQLSSLLSERAAELKLIDEKKKIKIGMVSLGCAKNRVDAEIMLGSISEAGYEITPFEDRADVIIVNTCGFIDSAKEEAIDAILEAAEMKEKGSAKAVIVSGCLAQRYGREILKSLPEVDAIVGAYGYSHILDAIESVLNRDRKVRTDKEDAREILKKGNVCYFDDAADFSLGYLDGRRILTTPASYAYLKIAEGCSNRCTYCAIPGIRGPYRSRPADKLLEEARGIAAQGVSEIVVIAQDTTMYGKDLGNGDGLPGLLEGLDRIDGIERVRILYLYPDEITDDILKAVKNCRKTVPYFDIPLQHISDGVLKRMNRRGNGALYRKVIEDFRKAFPECVIRTSLITGFPGETEENHRELKEFLKEYKLDRVGVFEYSREEGTPAARMKDQVHPATKKRRRRELMEIQNAISLEKNQSRIGKVYDVTVDGVSDDGMFYKGRSYMEAPEEDGFIYFAAKEELKTGQTVRVKIVVAEDYDLVGEQIRDED